MAKLKQAKDFGWHKVGFRMWERNRPDLYNAIIFGAPRYSMWAWCVWRKAGYTNGVEFSLEAARKSTNGIIAMLEAGSKP